MPKGKTSRPANRKERESMAEVRKQTGSGNAMNPRRDKLSMRKNAAEFEEKKAKEQRFKKAQKGLRDSMATSITVRAATERRAAAKAKSKSKKKSGK